MKTSDNNRSAEGIPDRRSKYEHYSERSSYKMSYHKGKGEVTSKGKRSKAGDKEHQYSEIRDSYKTEKSGGDPRKSKDHIHNGRPCLRSRSSHYSESSAPRIIRDKTKREVSPGSKRTVPDDTEKKSPEYITVSDIEKSLFIEGRVRNKRMKGLQWNEGKLKTMYDLDAQCQRNTNYRPQNWEHDRKQTYQSNCPRIFYDRYSPKKDIPVEKKTGPVTFKDRYVPNTRSHEYDLQ